MQCLQTYKSLAENESGFWMYANKLDNAGKQNGKDFRHYIDKNRMTAEFSPPYGSHSIDAFERLIQELWNVARTILLYPELPTELWAKAISHSSWLRSRLPSKWVSKEIPHKIWYNHQPDLSTILAFITKALAFHYRPNGKKFQTQTLSDHFVGMESDHTLYRIYVLTLNKVQTCRKRNFKVLKDYTILPLFDTFTNIISHQRPIAENEQKEEVYSAEGFSNQCFTRILINIIWQTIQILKDERVIRSLFAVFQNPIMGQNYCVE